MSIRALFEFEHSERIERQDGGSWATIEVDPCKGPRKDSNSGGGVQAWDYSFVSTDNYYQTLVQVSDSTACVVHRRGQIRRTPDFPLAVLGSADAVYVAVLVYGKSEGSLHRLYRLGTGTSQLHGAYYDAVVYARADMHAAGVSVTGWALCGGNKDCVQSPIGHAWVSVYRRGLVVTMSHFGHSQLRCEGRG